MLRFCFIVPCDWFKKNIVPPVNQSDTKPEPLATRSGAFSCIRVLIGTLLCFRVFKIYVPERRRLQVEVFIDGKLSKNGQDWRYTSAYTFQVYDVTFFLLPGFMADKLGDYTAAFLMAGRAGIIASPIPFLLHCGKRQEQNIIYI